MGQEGALEGRQNSKAEKNHDGNSYHHEAWRPFDPEQQLLVPDP